MPDKVDAIVSSVTLLFCLNLSLESGLRHYLAHERGRGKNRTHYERSPFWEISRYVLKYLSYRAALVLSRFIVGASILLVSTG
jgi:hypothetical protein